MYTISIDSPEGNALFDALLHSDWDQDLVGLYAELGLTPDDNNMMVPITF
jgi:hypothetical protein